MQRFHHSIRLFKRGVTPISPLKCSQSHRILDRTNRSYSSNSGNSGSTNEGFWTLAYVGGAALAIGIASLVRSDKTKTPVKQFSPSLEKALSTTKLQPSNTTPTTTTNISTITLTNSWPELSSTLHNSLLATSEPTVLLKTLTTFIETAKSLDASKVSEIHTKIALLNYLQGDTDSAKQSISNALKSNEDDNQLLSALQIKLNGGNNFESVKTNLEKQWADIADTVSNTEHAVSMQTEKLSQVCEEIAWVVCPSLQKTMSGADTLSTTDLSNAVVTAGPFDATTDLKDAIPFLMLAADAGSATSTAAVCFYLASRKGDVVEGLEESSKRDWRFIRRFVPPIGVGVYADFLYALRDIGDKEAGVEYAKIRDTNDSQWQSSGIRGSWELSTEEQMAVERLAIAAFAVTLVGDRKAPMLEIAKRLRKTGEEMHSRKAERIYRLLSRDFYPLGVEELGDMYAYGELGTDLETGERDFSTALKLYGMSARQRTPTPTSRLKLAYLFWTGLGVEQSDERAHRWGELALYADSAARMTSENSTFIIKPGFDGRVSRAMDEFAVKISGSKSKQILLPGKED
ncbi:hypothetical protein HK098_002281 [Nowakowskiella sp. JEL0407]|nr:hypothetical protein HK098_002281 [Nowakowskiella sp. JEL0407]